jgi:hypothetical protein
VLRKYVGEVNTGEGLSIPPSVSTGSTNLKTHILPVSQRPRGWRPDHPVTCSGDRCTLPTSVPTV